MRTFMNKGRLLHLVNRAMIIEAEADDDVATAVIIIIVIIFVLK
jgi:hypothetical protein